MSVIEGRKSEGCCLSGKHYFQACSVNLNRIVSRLKYVWSLLNTVHTLLHQHWETTTWWPIRAKCWALPAPAELFCSWSWILDKLRIKKQNKRNPSRAQWSYHIIINLVVMIYVCGVTGGSWLGYRSVRVGYGESSELKLKAEWPKVLFLLPADLPSGQWSGSWSNWKTAPVGCVEMHAAHKGAFCFSSPHGSSTLLGNSLAADIISLSTEWKKEYLSASALPYVPPSFLLFPLVVSLSLSLSLPPYLALVRRCLSFCAPFTQKVKRWCALL